jgi:hypothetical protein
VPATAAVGALDWVFAEYRADRRYALAAKSPKKFSDTIRAKIKRT